LILSRVTELVFRNILPYSPSGGLVLIDAKLVLFTLGAILGIGLLSGLYPAWQAGRIRPLEAIRSDVNG
jgi:ABC-type antimicrobial peptide transport system permease subunit